MNGHDILDHRLYPQVENMFSCPQSSSYASRKTIREGALSKEIIIDSTQKKQSQQISASQVCKCMCESHRVIPL